MSHLREARGKGSRSGVVRGGGIFFKGLFNAARNESELKIIETLTAN